MRRLVLGMHISLDGYVAGQNGEMNWIHVGEDIFEIAGELTRDADTALYGRKTWQMMDAYWPTAANKPNAGKHDVEHSAWYNSVRKLVVSTSAKTSAPNTEIINKNIVEKIKQVKQQPGKNIQIFGSPSMCHLLMQDNLIDDYWLFVNPVVLGEGIPLFKNIQQKIDLKLAASKEFASGVVCLHYQRK